MTPASDREHKMVKHKYFALAYLAETMSLRQDYGDEGVTVMRFTPPR